MSVAPAPTQAVNGNGKNHKDEDDVFMDIDSAAIDRMATKYDAKDLDDPSNQFVRKAFYTKLFPWKHLFQWLNRGMVPNRTFTNREIAFTLENDVYLRYNSFSDAMDFKKEALRLNPTRFEIGPVYTAKPKDRRTVQKANFKPIERELVLDVDMDDYNGLRTCCDGKGVCKRCWKFIAIAVRILDSVLDNEFGFQHRLWVFSGRRGIHCWISDTSAMTMKDDERRALVGYLEMVKGGSQVDRKVNLPRPLHPMVEKRMGYIKDQFKKVVLEEQNAFEDEERWESLLRSFTDKSKAQKLREAWKDRVVNSTTKWKAVEETFSEKLNRGQQDVEDLQVQYTWPRIDSEVSKHQNHLLKSPFVIHPATGKVCVPVDPLNVENFDPDGVPTLGQILRELDDHQGQIKSGREWEVTSMKKYVEFFQKHCREIMKTVVKERKGDAALRDLEQSWSNEDAI